MAKGSQLTQLKAALSQAGVTGQQSKKRKRSALVEKDKEKRTAKLQEIHQRLNPFDVKVTKLKHDVGGRRLKGITGKPAQSKQAGIEQRKKTLLKEYEEKERAGGVIDRRFGENDPSMSLEERMLERFTKERQRASKGAAFNLEDEDELTHYGQSLSKLDDFDNVGMGIDSDEEEETSGQIAKDVVRRDHFGGFSDDEKQDEDEPPRKKSKAEVMAEVMAKSKEHKMLRQIQRDKEASVRHELDDQFASLRELIFAPDPSSTGSNSVPLGIRANAAATGDEATKTPQAKDVQDDYDQHVRELAFDKRSKPKDRTKTEEELALEAKESLEKAERQRRLRMLGIEDSDNEEDTRGKGKRKRGADDLDDDFVEELGAYEELGAGLGDQEEVSDDDDDDEGAEEEEEGEESDSNGEWSEGDDEASELESDQDLEAEEGDHEQLVSSNRAPKKRGVSRVKDGKQELPFTFPCPATHEEFLDIVDGVDDEDVPTVIQRIRALHHTSLAVDNKFKLQTLATVLIDHILHIASPPQPRFSLISSLFPHLLSITQAYPIPVAQHFKQKLSLMHKNLKRGLSKGVLVQESKTWPGVPELVLLRLIGLIWPTSDLNHAVISPARVLLGAYLGLCRVRSLNDLTSGLFLSTLFLEYESLSKRFVPEAINFILNAILHLAPHKFKDSRDVPGSFPCPDLNSPSCQQLGLNPKANKSFVSRKPNLLNLMSVDTPSEQDKVDLLLLAFDLLGRFMDLYKGIEGFVELDTTVVAVLEGVHGKNLGDAHKEKLTQLLDSLRRMLKFSQQARKPLRLQAHKPIPIQTYIPKFETTKSNYLRRQDPDHEKNQEAKLRNQYKQERKGAIRELRKDARFLATVEQKKQIEKDRAYNERMRRVHGSIEGERAEQKTMEREKAKNKRRAGKK
ncbi:hypothetical protein CVT24_005768 [Panaeolus cyanescens]|uniref:Nucleolar protein 14 n=1 Tax=Panaeolus cyanescens TaxID=181874 RepID=A0A409V923_9AGAR|nr:hypothetical protein CVT24_005768 [Panaeolus cyanescens]